MPDPVQLRWIHRSMWSTFFLVGLQPSASGIPVEEVVAIRFPVASPSLASLRCHHTTPNLRRSPYGHRCRTSSMTCIQLHASPSYLFQSEMAEKQLRRKETARDHGKFPDDQGGDRFPRRIDLQSKEQFPALGTPFP